MPLAATKATNRVGGGLSRLSRQRRLRAALTKEPTFQEHQKSTKLPPRVLSWLSKMHSTFYADTNSLTNQGFHERPIERLEDNHLNAEHAAAITLSAQRWCDIIAQDRIQVNAQADMLLGNPTPGTPADPRADLEPDHQPNPHIQPGVEPDNEASDDSFYANLQDTYATAYQLRVPGTERLGI
jgi:hypothetical protein